MIHLAAPPCYSRDDHAVQFIEP